MQGGLASAGLGSTNISAWSPSRRRWAARAPRNRPARRAGYLAHVPRQDVRADADDPARAHRHHRQGECVVPLSTVNWSPRRCLSLAAEHVPRGVLDPDHVGAASQMRAVVSAVRSTTIGRGCCRARSGTKPRSLSRHARACRPARLVVVGHHDHHPVGARVHGGLQAAMIFLVENDPSREHGARPCAATTRLITGSAPRRSAWGLRSSRRGRGRHATLDRLHEGVERGESTSPPSGERG